MTILPREPVRNSRGTENGPSLATSVSELEASYRARIGEDVFALGPCAGAVPYLLRASAGCNRARTGRKRYLSNPLGR
ncbi:hypothetical protein D8S78_02035 [Natrialba swarupiae]|nr:hypothetical protein [Natrialba swarupiae]